MTQFIKSNMETKLNIIEILKDKPKNTKLYSPLFGNVYLAYIDIDNDTIEVRHHGRIAKFYGRGTFYGYPESELLLFPSKEMRDWSKFAWKKGDLLVNSCGFQCIFKEWASNDYTKFNGCYSNSRDGYEDISNARTDKFDKLDNNVACVYIRELERKLGGKLNLETLEIEKSAFKDGDILCVIDNSNDYHYILIYKGQDDKHIYRYVTMFEDNSLHIKKGSYFTKPKDYSIRYATEEEKQQLFDALAKEGKTWDAEKKEVVDLKPKWTPKPFDRVITRVDDDAIWTANIFSHIDQYGEYVTIGCESGYTYCLPYNEETAKLIGTTKDVED